ncbi:hypothetical protein NPIL_525901 [Nephila pilipes]|uniref:Uncharacterized protein n=1 Tax=Nephila pilipes TaxID=299642 RepID=A0A8X6PYZ3_NEPPI|nr:hypothetical protein NPIL_525901 [Nephila pilipes]
MPWMIVAILLTLLDTLSSEVACIRLADIYWNASNPIMFSSKSFHLPNGDFYLQDDMKSVTPPLYAYELSEQQCLPYIPLIFTSISISLELTFCNKTGK